MDTTIRVVLDIDAPLEAVWAVLSDLPAYPTWNPFTPVVETSGRPGDPVRLHVRLAGLRFTMNEQMRRYEAPHTLSWGVDWGWLLHAERTQTLTALGPDRTRYEAVEPFAGPLAPLVVLLFRGALERGFRENAEALGGEVGRRQRG